MSHYAPPPAEGMGSNRSNTISWCHVYWNHLFLSIWSTINWYSPSWRSGKATCRMLSTPRWANASSLPPGTFFLIFFSIFRFFIFSHFSLLQEVERWREKQRRRGQKAFQDSLIFLTLRILKNFSLRIYFLGLAFKKTKLILKSLKMSMLYCCSSYIAVIYSTLKQSPEQTKRAADNWATGKHLNQQPDNLLRTNLYWH